MSKSLTVYTIFCVSAFIWSFNVLRQTFNDIQELEELANAEIIEFQYSEHEAWRILRSLPRVKRQYAERPHEGYRELRPEGYFREKTSAIPILETTTVTSTTTEPIVDEPTCRKECRSKGSQCPVGRPGKPGKPGKKGEDGAPGQDGVPGASGIAVGIAGGCIKCPMGPEGPPGEDGPPGPDGAPGKAGANVKATIGRPGPPGPPGDRGYPGFPGGMGVPGKKGRDGMRYVSGVGSVGAAGPPGRMGPYGPTGRPGDRGPPGPMGKPGNSGRNGAPGLPGVEGKRGSPGKDGYYCQCPAQTKKQNL